MDLVSLLNGIKMLVLHISVNAKSMTPKLKLLSEHLGIARGKREKFTDFLTRFYLKAGDNYCARDDNGA